MITLRNYAVKLGTDTLFTIPSFLLSPQDKCALLAPNGTGKSVFMRQLYHNDIAHTMRLSYCPQQLDASMREKTMHEWIQGVDEFFNFNEYYRLCQTFDLDMDRPVITFSGGQERKATLAYAMSQSAEIYLLDEPTNHLDVSSILWLEKYVKNHLKSYLIISHDLKFLENTVTGYWAVHENVLRFYDGTYQDYLRKREIEEAALLSEHTKRLVTLKQEERYMERGVTARRKRNQKRVERLHDIRATLKNVTHKSQLQFSDFTNNEMPASQMIIRLKDFIPHYYTGSQALALPSIHRVITRKDRIAIVGENGRGKTTLLYTLLKMHAQEDVTIEHRKQLNVAFLDQKRLLDPHATVLDIVAGGQTHIEIHANDKIINIHPLSYLKRFGLDAERAVTTYDKLSGGEKMKVCLAKALAKPVDVLVLDEPTNDLDIEAIDELAELLTQFQGLVLLVSHDRYLIDQCVTETWYLTPQELIMHPGGFEARFIDIATPMAKEKKSSVSQDKTAKKVMARITILEKEIAEVEKKLTDHTLYESQHAKKLTTLLDQLEVLKRELGEKYAQWEAYDV